METFCFRRLTIDWSFAWSGCFIAGKKFLRDFQVEINDDFYVSVMEPVIYFTRGDIEINGKAEGFECLHSRACIPAANSREVFMVPTDQVTRVYLATLIRVALAVTRQASI